MYKNTTSKTSDKVLNILHENGFSHLFNWEDYRFYKKQGADAFNLAFEIAQQFINNADTPSDYEEYIF